MLVTYFVIHRFCLWRYVIVNVHFVYRIILSEIYGIGKRNLVDWQEGIVGVSKSKYLGCVVFAYN